MTARQLLVVVALVLALMSLFVTAYPLLVLAVVFLCIAMLV